MSGRLLYLFDRIISSFWFLPLFMAGSAVLLFFGTMAVDSSYQFAGLKELGPPFSIGPEGARQLLATIAGALITVASLVFSMTLVALTLAAGNIGARLLLRYMRNRTIKITLGLLLGSFVYSLLALSATGDSADLVPSATVFLAMVFTIVSFLWLVYAFHDLAETIQVDRAVGRAGETLRRAMIDLIDAGGSDQEDRTDDQPAPDGDPTATIPSVQSAYIQTIDRDALVKLACENDAIIVLHRRPGAFLMTGERLASVYCAGQISGGEDKFAEAVQMAVVMGATRTDSGDPFFCMRLLNEIAARALSPSMNDQYTALICVDQMINAVALTVNNALPDGRRYDEEGKLRVVLSAYGFENLLAQAVDELRRNAIDYPTVVIRLINRLCRLAEFSDVSEERAAIQDHAQLIMEQARDRADSKRDRRLIEESLLGFS